MAIKGRNHLNLDVALTSVKTTLLLLCVCNSVHQRQLNTIFEIGTSRATAYTGYHWLGSCHDGRPIK